MPRPAWNRRSPSLLLAAALVLALSAHARLVPAVTGYRPDDSSAHPPALLSQTGLYRDFGARALSDSIYAYSVNAPLWSDGAAKERFISVPFGADAVPTDSANYAFPNGTVLIKNFFIDSVVGDDRSRVPVETRLLVVDSVPGYAYYSGLSYRWRSDRSDADLVPAEGVDALLPLSVAGREAGKRWRYPSRSECNRCHVPESRGVLGFITPQLNRPSDSRPGVNQLQALADLGVLASNPLQAHPGLFRWRGADDSSASLEVRARSYLAANCSHCHGNHYNNHAVHSFDYFDSAQSDVYSLGNYQGYVGRPAPAAPATPQFIYPGHPDSSYVLLRMLARADFGATNTAMPPLATYQADSAALSLLRDWICGLAPSGLAPSSGVTCALPHADSVAAPYVGLAGRPEDGKTNSVANRKPRVILRGTELHVPEGAGPPALFDLRGHRIALRLQDAGIYRTEKPLRGVYLLKLGAERLRIESL